MTDNRPESEFEQLLDAASHDLKAPVRRIRTYADFLKDDLPDQVPEDAQNDLQIIRKEASDLQQLLNRLFQFFRISRTDPDVQELELSTLLDSTLNSLNHPRLDEAEIDVNNSLRISGDPDLLRLLFDELIDNALTFSDTETPRIQIAAREEDGVNRIQIIDSGPGIPGEERERLFSPLETLHTEGEDKNGAGLGLAICRTIANAHGGHVQIDPDRTDDGGTCVEVVLPGSGQEK